MNPPFAHLDTCTELDITEVARMIADGEDFVDAEARRVANAYLEREEK
jgi:hypothetical protein